MKSVKVVVLVAFLLSVMLGTTACKDKESVGDKGKTEEKGGEEGGEEGGEKGDEDVCAKAKACNEAFMKAEPDRKSVHESVWRAVQKAPEGEARDAQCKQVLKGASFNPNAPAECK